MFPSNRARDRVRTVFVCVVLEFGALIGIPVEPAQIHQLMHAMNEPLVAQTTPDECDTGDDGDAGTDAGGEWKVTQDRVVLICAFEQRGDELTGSCRPETGPEGVPAAGSVHDRAVRWHFDIALAPGEKKQTVNYEGTIDEAGRTIGGTFAVGDRSGPFTAEKQ